MDTFEIPNVGHIAINEARQRADQEAVESFLIPDLSDVKVQESILTLLFSSKFQGFVEEMSHLMAEMKNTMLEGDEGG